MSSTARKTHVLITDVGTYFGSELAKALIGAGCVVYGVGASRLSQHLLTSHDFTLLEIDLSQPLPSYLPQFDIIFDLSLLKNAKSSITQITNTSPQISNVITLTKRHLSSLFIAAPISTSPDFYDYLTGTDESLKDHINLLLIGDIYGPGMPNSEENRLSQLIKQATKGDKVILENEGLNYIYPTYITDAIYAVHKLAFEKTDKKIHYLVSESAKTTLSASYEIQNVARLALNKEIGLFFAGPEGTAQKEPQIEINTHEMGPGAKVNLAQGLKNTFQNFKLSGEQESSPSQSYIPKTATYQAVEKKTADVNTQKQQKQFKMPQIPSVNTSLSFKKVLLILLIVLALTTAKTSLDVYLGQKAVKAAQKSLTMGDFQSAKKQTDYAQKSFHAAHNKTRFIPIKNINNLLQGAERSAEAAGYFIDGAQTLAHDYSIIANPNAKNEGFDLETPSANFSKAYTTSTQAWLLIKDVSLPLANNKLQNVKVQLQALNTAAQRVYELTNLTNNLVGNGAKKTYLVLLQNNTELRPGGGFIGNFAIVQFDKGHLQNIQVEDIYTIDGQLKEKIQPPAPLKDKLGTDNYFLRDSNWSGDFTQNSRVERDFFKKETGQDVDGVIVMDLTLVQEILKGMGPISVPDYGQNITADNLFEKGEYYSEVGFFPGSTQKRDFFGALTRTMITKIVTDLQSPTTVNRQPTTNSLIALIQGAQEGLSQKHLMFTFDDPNLSGFAKTNTWDQPLPPLYFNPAEDTTQTRDYVALVEANVGANKVNRFLSRKVAYEMTVGKDADLVGKLTITYTNNSQADTWPGGKYVNYLRVYVPFAAGLFAYQNGDQSDLKLVEVTNQGSLTQLATYVEVPIKSTKVVTFTYRIPKNIKLETNPTYSVYFQKQAGTEKDPLEFKFNLPAYLTVKNVNPSSCHPELVSGSCPNYQGQNITINSDLSTDRQFTINLKKN
ncbi:MAG TPA: DUF4012 domain-containing protein [Candidatus Saccharimonadales bacterium]|nr:DUF4012 domain-containing protein [Candidatus Saccharimonadales bacterium]